MTSPVPVATTRWFEPLLYLVAMAVTSVATFFALELWKADLRVPLLYAGDALPVGAHFKTVMEEGWYEHQPRLGAPWGQVYNDFPTADNLHLIAAKVIALFTSDWALALNAYFLIGFPLAAAAAVWFLRTCRVSATLIVPFATLFAIAPYHFLRGESHLWLASYYAIPLALGILVLLLRRQPLFARGRASNPALALVFSPTTRTVLWIVILGTSSSYYSVFFLLLLTFTGIVVLLRDRRWKPFIAAVGVGVLTIVVMLINMLPDLVYLWEKGANPGSLERSRAEAEIYAFKIAQLLLPWPGHRIEPLRALRERYDTSYLASAEGPALGLVAAAGLVAAIAIVVVLAVYRRPTWTSSPQLSLSASLSSIVMIAVVFATVGGFSTFISFFTSSLRGWNRMSIVIAMLCLGIVALLLDWLLLRASTKRRWTQRIQAVIAGALGVLILVVGFVDQTPANASGSYAAIQERFRADTAYFSEVESRLPDGAMVLLLPYVPFPEGYTAAGFLASDQLVPYLQTSELRWTNGGIKGRPIADWPGELANYEPATLALLAATAGSSAVVVQRTAIPDSGRAIEEGLRSATGDGPFESPDGIYAMYDLTEVAEQLASEVDDQMRQDISLRITDPVIAYPSPDFVTVQATGVYKPGVNGSTFSIVNDADTSIEVHLATRFECESCEGAVNITLGDRPLQPVPLTAGAAELDEIVTVPSGTTAVTVSLTNTVGGPIATFTMTPPSIQQVPVLNYLSTLSAVH